MPPLVLDGQLRYRMFLLRCFRFVVEDMEEAGAQLQEVDVAGDSVNRGTGTRTPRTCWDVVVPWVGAWRVGEHQA